MSKKLQIKFFRFALFWLEFGLKSNNSFCFDQDFWSKKIPCPNFTKTVQNILTHKIIFFRKKNYRKKSVIHGRIWQKKNSYIYQKFLNNKNFKYFSNRSCKLTIARKTKTIKEKTKIHWNTRLFKKNGFPVKFLASLEDSSENSWKIKMCWKLRTKKEIFVKISPQSSCFEPFCE